MQHPAAVKRIFFERAALLYEQHSRRDPEPAGLPDYRRAAGLAVPESPQNHAGKVPAGLPLFLFHRW